HIQTVLHYYPATRHISALPLHDALPIAERIHCMPWVYREAVARHQPGVMQCPPRFSPSIWGSSTVFSVGTSPALDPRRSAPSGRSEEHTSELQSLRHLVCRLVVEKRKEA